MSQQLFPKAHLVDLFSFGFYILIVLVESIVNLHSGNGVLTIISVFDILL